MTKPASTKNILKRLQEIGGVIKLQGKDYVTIQGLLFLAHENGLTSIQTDIQQLDYENKFCLVQATIHGKKGAFVTHGDADSSNLNSKMITAFIRMAETRAICRGLRLYTGIGMTAKDELPTDMLPEEDHEPDPERIPTKKKTPQPKATSPEPPTSEPTPNPEDKDALVFMFEQMGRTREQLEADIRLRHADGTLRGHTLDTLTNADINLIVSRITEPKE